MATNKMNNKTSIVAGWIIIASILIQFIPLTRIDQPSKEPSQIPVSVLAVLKSHCFDCHSSETRWPQTAYIAPLSWYVTAKVRQARKAIDFSNFDALPDDGRRDIKRATSSLARSKGLSAHGEIPGFPKIKMTERERQALAEWAADNNRE